MNNYCTNCGKKLNENVIKCEECNTYVIDIKKTNKKKIFRTISIIIGILVVGIILMIFCYSLYYKILSKTLYNKYLKENYNEAKYYKHVPCRICDSSCDGSCIKSSRIIGCFKYYYKSNPNIENPDIMIVSNKGTIEVDIYSPIIDNYGFNEYEDYLYDEYQNQYNTKSRSYLNISVDHIGSDNIEKIYEMISELIDAYKKYNKNNLDITIENNYNSIFVSNYNTSQKLDFNWEIGNISLTNPTLDDIKMIYGFFESEDESMNRSNNIHD